MQQTIKHVILVSSTIYMYSCAAIAPPSGGPEDTTPPELISSFPKSGSTNFTGGEVILKFSEYLNKASIKNAIKISPKVDPPVKIKYKDDKLLLLFPRELLENQTYVITINRNLSDERKVPIRQSVQIAFSSGDIIEEGVISGRVFGDEKYAAHLWRIKSEFRDSIFFSEPLYAAEADDFGNFNFKYLSKGQYVLLGVDKSGYGSILIPERMGYAISSKKIFQLSSNEKIKNINLRAKKEIPKLKLSHGEWMGKRWGWMNFTSSIVDAKFEDLTITDENEKIIALDYFQDAIDKKRFLLISKDTIASGKAILNLKKINNFSKKNSGKINFRVPSKKDTTNLKIIKPKASSLVRMDKFGGPYVPIIFSKPIVESFEFTLVSDSDTVLIRPDFINPMAFNFAPPNGWKEKTSYRLMFKSKELIPIEGKGLKDSVLFLNISSDKKIGYGNFNGSIKENRNLMLIELQSIKNRQQVFYSSVNFKNEFILKSIPEGSYILTVIEDTDNSNTFSYGGLAPFHPSERFYVHPDTFKIRRNWDIQVGPIEIGKN